MRGINIGDKFPTVEVAARVTEILRNKKLYKGKQSEVYMMALLNRLELAGVEHRVGNLELGTGSEMLVNKYKNVIQGVNVTAPVCNAFADLLFSEGLGITDTKNNDWIKEWTERVNFSRKLHLGQVGAGYRGDAIIKVWEDEARKAKLSIIPSEYWVPVTSLEDNTAIEYHQIVHLIELSSAEKKKLSNKRDTVKLLRVVEYHIGINNYKAFAVVNGVVKEQIEWNEARLGKLPTNYKVDGLTIVEETGLNYNQIQNIPNRENDDNVFGEAFITDSFIDNEREITIRATQRSRILDKNADPGMYGARISEVDAGSGESKVKVSGKYIEVDQDDIPPAYITWEGSLEENRLAEQKCMEHIYQETGTNAALLSATSDGIQTISGAALEKVLMRPLSVVKTLKQNWKPAINKILKLAYQIETGKTYTDEEVEAEYKRLMFEQKERESFEPLANDEITFGDE